MSTVPRLTTALSGLPLGLERQILDKSVAIDSLPKIEQLITDLTAHKATLPE